MAAEIFEMGKIVGTHGIKGEVRAQSWGNDESSLLGYDFFLVGKEHKRYNITYAKAHKNVVIIKFEGVDSIDEAQKLAGSVMYLYRDNMKQLPKGEVYIADLLGLPVILPDGEEIGIVCDVFPTGANDVVAIKTPDGKELLAPFIKDCFPDLDISDGKLLITPIEGLFDDEI